MWQSIPKTAAMHGSNRSAQLAPAASSLPASCSGTLRPYTAQKCSCPPCQTWLFRSPRTGLTQFMTCPLSPLSVYPQVDRGKLWTTFRGPDVNFGQRHQATVSTFSANKINRLCFPRLSLGRNLPDGLPDTASIIPVRGKAPEPTGSLSASLSALTDRQHSRHSARCGSRSRTQPAAGRRVRARKQRIQAGRQLCTRIAGPADSWTRSTAEAKSEKGDVR